MICVYKIYSNDPQPPVPQLFCCAGRASPGAAESTALGLEAPLGGYLLIAHWAWRPWQNPRAMPRSLRPWKMRKPAPSGQEAENATTEKMPKVDDTYLTKHDKAPLSLPGICKTLSSQHFHSLPCKGTECVDQDFARGQVPGHYELCVCEAEAVPMSLICQGWHHLGHLEVFGPLQLKHALHGSVGEAMHIDLDGLGFSSGDSLVSVPLGFRADETRDGLHWRLTFEYIVYVYFFHHP